MSDSSKVLENVDLHSNEINDEPLDPRIQIELERANAATIEINNLETQLDNAQKLFQITFNNSKQRLAILAKKLGRCVERARPYYNICKQAEQAQIETQQAAQEYQNSVELYHTAQENLHDVETQSSKIDNLTRQEYINHMTIKVTQAKQDKIQCEQIHEEKSKLYQEYEQQRLVLLRSLTRAINKSKSYFQEKSRVEKELQKQKLCIEDIQKAIIQAKQTYRTAFNNLEQISEEIHLKRQNQILIKLPLREPTIGAEKPIDFLEFSSNLELTEFPKIDLSDDLSDTELSNSINSISINTSTNSLPNSLTNNLTNHFSTQAIPYINNNYQREKSHLSDKYSRIPSKRFMMNNETPLLSHLFGTPKYPSDPNINFLTKH